MRGNSLESYICSHTIEETFNDNPLLEAALSYAERGWPVIALHTPTDNGCSCNKKECSSVGKHPRYHEKCLAHGLNSATTDEEIIRQWWALWPDANVGIVTGKKAGFMVLDIDIKDDGEHSLTELEDKYGKIPETVETITGSGGRHILFAYPGQAVANRTGFVPGLDIRGDGGYIVAPPSLHASGRAYEWELSSHPDYVDFAPVPEWLLTLISQPKPEPKDKSGLVASAKIPSGKRNSTLTSLAGSMRRNGMSREAIEAALLEENLNSCTSPLPEPEVIKIAESVANYEPGNSKSIPKFNLTDMGNAERLIARHGKDIRYCPQQQQWWIYDGTRWIEDHNSKIFQFAKDTVRQIYNEAAGATDENERRPLAQHAMGSESERKIRSMISLARSEPGVSINMDQFDQDHWLLNCLNGTLDLRTGKLIPHQQDHLLTKTTPINYDPEARCDLWLSFLDRIMEGNAEMISFLQRAVGYSLTGDTSEQVFFLLHGTGANGKSTLLETVRFMLGDFAQQTDSNTFLIKNNDGVRNDLAKLRGARFVSAVEVEEGRRLAETLVKRMTGGDRIMARFLFKDYFEYDPTFKIFLAANHKPVIRGTDYAMWRRIRFIRFKVTIPDSEKDGKLKDKLRSELPGILSWAVQGCLDWQKNGLGTPPEVIEATNNYREEMDVFANFLSECCIVQDKARVPAKALKERYQSWCKENGEYPMKSGPFKLRLEDRGFICRRSGASGSDEWHGIGLLLSN